MGLAGTAKASRVSGNLIWPFESAATLVKTGNPGIESVGFFMFFLGVVFPGNVEGKLFTFNSKRDLRSENYLLWEPLLLRLKGKCAILDLEFKLS